MRKTDVIVIVIGAGAAGLGAEFIHGSAPELDDILAGGSIASVDISGRPFLRQNRAAVDLRTPDA